MEYENLRLWGYASAVDNGTHILLYYMVMSTLGQDPDKVAMYTALAISADRGASFVKPELGLVDVGDGGKNNIVWPLAPKTVSKSGDHQTGTVWIDSKPGTPAAEKYKMLALWNPPGGKGMGTFAWASPDGINWKVLGDPKTPLYTGSDTQQVGFFDERLGKYVAYRRNWPTDRKKGGLEECVGSPPHCGATFLAGRKVGRCVSDTLTSFKGCSCSCTDTSPPKCSGEGPSCTFQVLSFDDHDSPIVDICERLASLRPFCSTLRSDPRVWLCCCGQIPTRR